MAASRKGPSARVAQVQADVARKLVYVRALYLAVYNEPDLPLDAVAAEFYASVGEILEGKPLRNIEFNKIPRERVLALAKEGV